MGLSALGLQSNRNLGLLLHLLGLKPSHDALAGLDGVLIGLRTRELLQKLLEARCRSSPGVIVIEEPSLDRQRVGGVACAQAGVLFCRIPHQQIVDVLPLAAVDAQFVDARLQSPPTIFPSNSSDTLSVQ